MIKYIILRTIIVLIIVIALIILGGLIAYETGYAESWNKGSYIVYRKLYEIFRKIRAILKKIAKRIWDFLKKWVPVLLPWLYEAITGKSLPPNSEDMVREYVYLLDSELDELVNALDGRPYIAPVLAEPPVEINHIIWVHINAVGFNPKYKEMEIDELKRLIKNVIKGFYQKHRSIVDISIYVKAMTPCEVMIAIPVTQKADDFLGNQERNSNMTLDAFTEKALTEIIPDEEVEIKNDYWL